MKARAQKIILFFGMPLLGGAAVLFLLNFPVVKAGNTSIFGITFTPGQATSLGLDWKETYGALLDDLGVRHVRLAAYWNVTEATNNTFDFSEVDYQMDELAKRGGKALLAVGRKLPRWPECHEPGWAKKLSQADYKKELFEYQQAVVERYKRHPALLYWQIENETTFPFGECDRTYELATLGEQVALARALDPKHKIVVTDSGEWTAWIPLGLYGDILGSSLYREAWNGAFGRVSFPIGPGWYQLRARLLEVFGKKVFISELQGEPWGNKGIAEMSVSEGLENMSVEKLMKNISFAKSVGFEEMYLWGAEWWYWLKINGNDTLWREIRPFFNEKMN